VNQVVLKAMLSKTGYKIDVVGNGSEAVSAVMRVPYDLVLMDVHMPEMDGVTATRNIRELSGEVRNIPIIALTANAMKGDREKYLGAGMNAYVTKPIDPYELAKAIASQCDVTILPPKPAVAPVAPVAPTSPDDVIDLLDSLDGLTGTDG